MARAADLLAECLAAHGLDRMFCVPGESYLALLDALAERSDIDLVACRHEGGAGLMGVADAKLTGRPGLVAVSRGPGASNAAIAVHLAEQDAVPLLLLVGQVARHERGRGAFQEVDYAGMFGGIAKGVWEVTDPARLPGTLARALHDACAPTPGPVVVALPEDMLDEATEAAVAAPLPVARAGVAAADMDAVTERLSRAERPLLIAGSDLARPEGRAALARAAEAHRIPVALTFKQQHIFDNASPLYAGHLGFKAPPALIEALGEADLVLAVGARLGDTPTQGWRLPRAPEPDQPLIHVHADPAVIGRHHRAEIGLCADPAAFLSALTERNAPAPERGEWIARAHGAATALSRPAPRAMADGLDFGHVAAALAKAAPEGAIVVTDSGNFSSWISAWWPWTGAEDAIGAVGGAMGLGVPGAVAACLRRPEACVIAVIGDGGALMTGAELATALATGAKPKIFVAKNRSYGTIRLHQEKAYPGRVSGTDLVNPDFAAWGRAFGALGLTVDAPEQAEAAVAEALAHDGPVVVDVEASVEAISAFATISGLRGA